MLIQIQLLKFTDPDAEPDASRDARYKLEEYFIDTNHIHSMCISAEAVIGGRLLNGPFYCVKTNTNWLHLKDKEEYDRVKAIKLSENNNSVPLSKRQIAES
jgi:hypothetical protein